MEPLLAAGSARRLEETFARLVELPVGERRRWLDEECPDPQLRRELETLLEADARAEGVLGSLGAEISRRVAGSTHPPPADPLQSLPAGIEIAHYRVVAPVGRGGMGIVVRARDLRLQRDVALKLLPPHSLRSDDAKRRLLREARAAAALDHPNLCTVYEIGEAPDGGLFIAMPYYAGETLAARLRRGPLAPAEALGVLLPLSTGLAAAHHVGICHCDVKPSNVILTSAGTVKLVDFGIARAPSDATDEGRIRGTLAYMAPEQLRGEEVDARADVWALGVLLLECLTGANPFRATTDAVTLYRVLHAASPTLPDTLEHRDALQALLARCLAARREERYPDAAAVHEALRNIRESGGGPASTSGDGPGAAPGVAPRARRAIPVAPTRLIGREQELRDLEDALRSARLVTVTGTAGTGKTRLVLDALRHPAPRVPAGTVFVSLAAVTDPGLVASEIAAELGLVDQPTRAVGELLCEHIGGHEVLLVLDNFEQVAAAAPLLAELLARCSGLRILVTSRVVLRLRGEQELPLDPLPLPPEAEDSASAADSLKVYAATALFLERARAVRPDLEVDDATARAILAICRRLDGLPLAIELAAARVRLFSPAALLERLATPLELLGGGARDLPDRHRTLRDALAWSYRLLGPEEQWVFRRMGVFAGGVDLEALEELCAGALAGGSVLPAVSGLVEHSLLRAVPGAGERPRFVMLETIREYALEQLSLEQEVSETRRRHAEHHLRLAEAGAKALSGPEQALWLERLEQEHDNLRAALGWAEASGEVEITLRIGAALCRFWTARGHVREGLEVLDRLRKIPVVGDLLRWRAAVLAGAGSLLHETGEFRGAQPPLEEALALFRELGEEASVAGLLNTLAWTHAHTGPLQRAERLAQEALEVCSVVDDERGIAVALHNLSWIAVYRGTARHAISFANRALAIRDRLGDRRGAAFTRANRARAERQAGEFAAAHATLAEAAAVTGELNDRQLPGLIRMVGGQLLLTEGNAAAAAESLREALDHWQGVRHDFAAGDCLNWLAAAVLELGRPGEAAALLARAEGIWERIGGPWGRGATWFRRGQLARRTGQPDAQELLQRSLVLRREIGDRLGQAECLEELALCSPPTTGPSAVHPSPADLIAEADELRRALGAPRLR